MNPPRIPGLDRRTRREHPSASGCAQIRAGVPSPERCLVTRLARNRSRLIAIPRVTVHWPPAPLARSPSGNRIAGLAPRLVHTSIQLLKRRRVVERTLAWLNRNRRLAKHFEASVESAVAWLLIASIKLLTRGLARA